MREINRNRDTNKIQKFFKEVKTVKQGDGNLKKRRKHGANNDRNGNC